MTKGRNEKPRITGEVKEQRVVSQGHLGIEGNIFSWMNARKNR